MDAVRPQVFLRRFVYRRALSRIGSAELITTKLRGAGRAGAFLFSVMTRFALTLASCLFVTSSIADAQTTALTAVPRKAPPPTALAPTIAQRLSPESVQVILNKGATTLDFWWVAGLPAKGGTASASWADVEEGSLVGAVSISSDFRDIRGRVIKAGIYTLRYGIQPQNGDHLGVSPYREFLLLSPAAIDNNPSPRGHEGTIELSKQAIGGSHPGVWSLDPPVARDAPLKLHKTELEHDAVIMEIPITRDGKPSGVLKFGVVLIGKIEA